MRRITRDRRSRQTTTMVVRFVSLRVVTLAHRRHFGNSNTNTLNGKKKKINRFIMERKKQNGWLMRVSVCQNWTERMILFFFLFSIFAQLMQTYCWMDYSIKKCWRSHSVLESTKEFCYNKLSKQYFSKQNHILHTFLSKLLQEFIRSKVVPYSSSR